MGNDNKTGREEMERIVRQLNEARARVGLKPLSRSWMRRYVLERGKGRRLRR